MHTSDMTKTKGWWTLSTYQFLTQRVKQSNLCQHPRIVCACRVGPSVLLTSAWCEPGRKEGGKSQWVSVKFSVRLLHENKRQTTKRKGRWVTGAERRDDEWEKPRGQTGVPGWNYTSASCSRGSAGDGSCISGSWLPTGSLWDVTGYSRKWRK